MQKTNSSAPSEEIKDVLDMVQADQIPRRLAYIYNQAPINGCNDCTKCCFSCVQVHPIEFLNIYLYLRTLPKLTQVRLAKKLIKYEMLHLTTLEYKCPFLENDSCIIIDYRPLLCRLFGFYTETEHKEMAAKSLKENEQLAMEYARQDRILLPEEVMTYDVEHCQTNTDKSGNQIVVASEERQRLHQQIYSLSEQVVPDEWLSPDMIRFSYQYALFYLSEEEIDKTRINAIKEFQAGGSSPKLDRLIAGHRFCL